MAENDPILVKREGHIGLITLNRPDQMNTFTVEFARQLNDALASLDADDAIRVVVIQGAAPFAFSVGIELDCFQEQDPRRVPGVDTANGRPQPHHRPHEESR